MQISRHWRINKERYRLEGVRLQNGDVALHPKSVGGPEREGGGGGSEQPAPTAPVEPVIEAAALRAAAK